MQAAPQLEDQTNKKWDEKANCCCIGDDTCYHVDCTSPYGCLKCAVIMPTRCCAAPLRCCGVDFNPIRICVGDCSCGLLCCLKPGFWCMPMCPTMEMLDVYAADGKNGLRTVNRLNQAGPQQTQMMAPQIIMMQAPAPAAAPAVIINQAAPVIQQQPAPTMMMQPPSPNQQ